MGDMDMAMDSSMEKGLLMLSPRLMLILTTMEHMVLDMVWATMEDIMAMVLATPAMVDYTMANRKIGYTSRSFSESTTRITKKMDFISVSFFPSPVLTSVLPD